MLVRLIVIVVFVEELLLIVSVPVIALFSGQPPAPETLRLLRLEGERKASPDALNPTRELQPN